MYGNNVKNAGLSRLKRLCVRSRHTYTPLITPNTSLKYFRTPSACGHATQPRSAHRRRRVTAHCAVDDVDVTEILRSDAGDAAPMRRMPHNHNHMHMGCGQYAAPAAEISLEIEFAPPTPRYFTCARAASASRVCRTRFVRVKAFLANITRR